MNKASKDYLIELANGNYDVFPMIYSIEGIEPLCSSCNSRKGIKVK